MAKALGAQKHMADRKQAFLEAYLDCCMMQEAAKRAGISRNRHYDWIRDDEHYKVAFEEVRERIGDRLEDEAIRRAVYGVSRAVTVAGKREEITEYSDTLLAKLLTAAKPEKYRERSGFGFSLEAGTGTLRAAVVVEFVRPDNQDPLTIPGSS